MVRLGEFLGLRERRDEQVEVVLVDVKHENAETAREFLVPAHPWAAAG